jgi:O-antigen/teichoic acid export membrane protein
MLQHILNLIRDSVTYGTANLIQKIVGFILIPLYTRLLTPEDYGIIALLLIAKTIFEAVGFVGMKITIFRKFGLLEGDAERRSKVLASGLFIACVACCILLTLSFLFSESITILLMGDAGHEQLLQIALIASSFQILSDIPSVALQADRQAKTVALISVFRVLFSTLLTLFFVAGLRMGVLGIVAASLISNVIFALVYLHIGRKRYGLFWNFQMVKELSAFGLPVIPYRIQLAIFVGLSEFVIRTKLGLAETGLYAIALRFVMPMGFVAQAVNTAWWPYRLQILEEEKSPEETYRTMSVYYFAAMIYLWMGVSIWGTEILQLVTPVEYHPAITLVPLLAMAKLLSSFYTMFSTGIEFGENIRPISLVGTAALAVGIPSALVLVETHQSVGVAASFCLANVAMVFAGYQIARKQIQIPYEWTLLAIFSGLAGILFFCSQAASDLWLPMRFLVHTGICLAYPILIFLVLCRTESEKERMRLFVNRLIKRK